MAWLHPADSLKKNLLKSENRTQSREGGEVVK
jgi:hypothetical protein